MAPSVAKEGVIGGTCVPPNGMKPAYPFHNDGSLEYRQLVFAMNLANVYAKYRAAGITYTREEFHNAAIDNMDKINICLKQPLTKYGNIK